METALKDQLVAFWRGGQAHAPVEEAVRAFPPALADARVDGIPYTPWRLLEHLRIAQWDILEFSRNPDHVSPEFPEGYWPAEDSPPQADSWEASVTAFCSDLQAVQRLVLDPSTDLFEPIPHGDGQTPLREAMLVADHNAYHLGQLLAIRRSLEISSS